MYLPKKNKTVLKFPTVFAALGVGLKGPVGAAPGPLRERPGSPARGPGCFRVGRQGGGGGGVPLHLLLPLSSSEEDKTSCQDSHLRTSGVTQSQ